MRCHLGHVAAIMATLGKAHPANLQDAAFYSVRQGGRPVAVTVKCALLEAEAMPLSEDVAPSDERQFTAYVVREDWREALSPAKVKEASELIVYGKGT